MNIPISLSIVTPPSESNSRGRVHKESIERREKPEIEAKKEYEGKTEREDNSKPVPKAFNAILNQLAAKSDVEFSQADIDSIYAQIAETGTLDAETSSQIQSALNKIPSGKPFDALFASLEAGLLAEGVQDIIPEAGVGTAQTLPVQENIELPAISQATVPDFLLDVDALSDNQILASVGASEQPSFDKLVATGESSDVVITDEEALTLHKALSALTSKFLQGRADALPVDNSQSVRMQLPQDIPVSDVAASVNSALTSKWFENSNGPKRFVSFDGEVSIDTEGLISSSVGKAVSSVTPNGGGQPISLPQGIENQLAGQNGSSNLIDNSALAGVFGSQFAVPSEGDFSLTLDNISLQMVNAANTAPQGIAAVHQMSVTAPSTPAGQIVAAALEKGVMKDGSQRIAVSLNPPELGRVIADIELDAKSKIKVNITVEKEGAFHMLQRDQALLEQALHKAGLDFDSADLQFSFNEGGSFDEAFENPKYLAGNADKSSGEDGVDGEMDNIAELDIPQGEYIDTDTGMTRYHAVV